MYSISIYVVIYQYIMKKQNNTFIYLLNLFKNRNISWTIFKKLYQKTIYIRKNSEIIK